MKIYLVGGAVRDHLLNLPVTERDWVVVGATVNDMLQQGFRSVGKDFPVFLHPKSNEEYALARTERKVRRGYTGFDFDTSQHVTLEEDLKRRDLTINAMAETPDGKLVDPYHGQQDLQNKILRHVSSAFVEDPVRILRVARFAARYAELGFKVAPETIELMRQMVLSGEVDALVPERVWKEFEKALGEPHPEQFFQALADCDALPVLFPELGMDTAGMKALAKAAKVTKDTQVRFAALVHDLPESEVKKLCERYRVPNDYRDLAVLVTREGNFHFYNNFSIHQSSKEFHLQGAEIFSKKILRFFLDLDAFRREERFEKFLLTCEICSKQSSSEILKQCYSVAKAVNAKELMNQGMSGAEIGSALVKKRIEAIENFLANSYN